MAYIDMSRVDVSELKQNIKALNKSGALRMRIRLAYRVTGDKSPEDLAKDFISHIEALNMVGGLDDIPKGVFKYYERIVQPGYPDNIEHLKLLAKEAVDNATDILNRLSASIKQVPEGTGLKQLIKYNWIKWPRLFKAAEKVEQACGASGNTTPIKQAIKQRDTLYRRTALVSVMGEPTGDEAEDRRRVYDAQNTAERDRLSMVRLLKFAEAYRKAAGVSRWFSAARHKVTGATYRLRTYRQRRKQWVEFMEDMAKLEVDVYSFKKRTPIISAAAQVCRIKPPEDQHGPQMREQDLKKIPPEDRFKVV